MQRRSDAWPMHALAALVLWGAIAFAAPVAAQEADTEAPSPPGDTVLLRFQPVVGSQQEFLFEMSCRLEMSARALGIQLDRVGISSVSSVTQIAKERRDDGTVVMETIGKVLQAVPAPGPGEQLGSAHNLITLDSTRKLLEVLDAPDAPPAEDPGLRDLVIQIMDGICFPEQPVAIGDRWEARHEITMPETGRVTEMDVWGELRGRVLDGDRWVSVIYTELQIPLRLNHEDTEIRGSIGIRLNLEVFEDTGDIRYADGTGQGSAKPDLAVRVAKIRLRNFTMKLRRVMPDGRLLGSALLPEAERLFDPPEIEPPAPSVTPESVGAEESTL